MRISPLRRRMIDDMTARHFGEKTQKDYIRCVKNLAAFIGRAPETATAEDLRLYRLHLVQSLLGAASVNSAMTALPFFFSITLDRYDLLKPLFRVEEPRKLPTVLTQEEVARLLECASRAIGGAERRLWRGAPGLRSSVAEGFRYRQRPHGLARRARQGTQGPARHAFPHAARYFAGVVAHRPAAGLAVSGPEPDQPDDHAAVEPRLPRGSPCCRDQQACFTAHA